MIKQLLNQRIPLASHQMYRKFTSANCDTNSMAAPHVKARTPLYGKGETTTRFPVPDEKVPWSVSFDEYKPVYFEVSKLKSSSWADPDIKNNPEARAKMQFNKVDNRLNRVSHMGEYVLDAEGLPLNPRGRTGICGRGCLGRWGPNHAADPVVTRWKLSSDGSRCLHPDTGKPILQFVSILRGDVRQWAIPGGMVDLGEEVSATLKREFGEEALDTTTASAADRQQLLDMVNDAFHHGVTLYSGYVDDPRNTDNAWMETVAVNFHDEEAKSLAKFSLTAGDDAVGVRWTDVSSSLALYASHKDFVKMAAELRQAHW